MSARVRLASALLLLFVATTASAATIVIVNKDPAGVGFNDTTPASPVGGNNGTTLGQQRLNVFQAAANVWAAKLNSSITIKIAASFGALTPCSSTFGVIGSAGPTTFVSNFTNAPKANTYYPVALASALASYDYATYYGIADGASIRAQFNSNIGTPDCLSGMSWYLGVDDNFNHSTQLDLETVLLHEFGHGLGFVTLADLTTGAFPNNTPDIFSNYIFDNSVLMHWNVMSNAQRLTSTTNTGNVVFDGPAVTAGASILTAGKDASGHPRLYTPSTLQSGSSVSHFDTVASPNQLMEPTITTDLTHNVDLPYDLTMKEMLDIGWQSGPAPCYTLTTAINPTGIGGSVGVGTSSNCTGGFTSGTQISLSANPPSGYVFSNWSYSGGTLSSTTTNPTTLTINGNATVTANLTSSGGGSTTSEIVLDGGFEQATSVGNSAPGWTILPALGHNLIQPGGSYPHTGSVYAYLGAGNSSTDVIKQTVTIPSNATAASLTFWVNVVTQEAIGGGAYDWFYVDFYTTNGSWVQSLANLTNEDAPRSNNTNGVYFKVGPIDVTSLKGSTLQLAFEVDTDSSLLTTFRLDDISLLVTTPSQQTCSSFAINPPGKGATSSAGSQLVTVTGSPSGCAGGSWSASGNGSWITVSPTSGSGSGSTTVSWAANTSTLSRSGWATIAGNSFNVNQDGVPPPTCGSFTIAPGSAAPPYNAGSQQVTITGSPSGCQGGNWTASGDGGFVTVSPSSGTGSGMTTVYWTQNNMTTPRAGYATIAGNTFSVNQSGAPPLVCTSFGIAPNSATPSSAAGSQSVTIVGSPTNCQGGTWTASGNGSWITVSPSSGSGSGMTTVYWTQNTTAATRSGSATIAGNSFSVTQAGAVVPSGKRGDFNADGKSDVLWHNNATGDSAIWFMNGTNATYTMIARNDGVNWSPVAIGDFDGDGKTDIFWRNTVTGENRIWFMNGAVVTSVVSMLTVPDLHWVVQGSGDFNGDGKFDILWRNTATGDNAMWLLNGSQATYSMLLTIPDQNWTLGALGDFDGDGKYDVLWHNIATGGNVVWIMNGATLASHYELLTTGLTWSPSGAADYDGDGKFDIFWRDSTSGSDAIWFMTGVGTMNPVMVPGTVPVALRTYTFGDFNGDGKADVFWRNTVSGETAVWLMNGVNYTSAASQLTVPDQSWQPVRIR